MNGRSDRPPVVSFTMDAPPTAAEIRRRLAFDVERLRGAASRLDRIDRTLLDLRRALQRRAQVLSSEATRDVEVELGGDGRVQLRYAQAHATAELARRATLAEILRHESRLSLIASMAVNRWVGALCGLGAPGVSAAVVKGHIDAGRVAHRLLATWRPKAKLKSGCGQITSAIVVREFVHADHAEQVDTEILDGLARGRQAAGVRGPDDVLAAASRALRSAADLLEAMGRRAEPFVDALVERAASVEAEVEAALWKGRDTPLRNRPFGRK